jgi:hypothetical protein
MVLDESLHDQLLTVGGYFVRSSRLPELAERWRTLKTDVFGLPAEAELKYTMPDSHEARRICDENGWKQRKRVPKMLRTIRQLDLMILADTMLDLREEKSPKDFYVYALKWCLRRFANQVEDIEKGVHWVLVDMYTSAGLAPFEAYQGLYWKPEKFPGYAPAPSLRDSGFVPTLTMAHARYTDVLQIADVIAGCVREFCSYNITRAEVDDLPDIRYEDRNMALIASYFRSGPRGIGGYGFDVFPDRHPARWPLRKWAERLATEGQVAVSA